MDRPGNSSEDTSGPATLYLSHFPIALFFNFFPGRDQQKDQHSLLQEAEGGRLLTIQKYMQSQKKRKLSG